MKKYLFAAIVSIILVSCGKTWKSEDYLSWMYKYMPFPDSAAFSSDWWLANIDKTLEVREKMGWNVPEREFRHFVLPLRVNNEFLDDFRTTYSDTLCSRVKGMSMEQAAMEINHWCFEQATYHGSDGRTMSPMATARSGFGRCGEESVLTVAALRAAGLPARQVYTPRWAHTDDNHAWVEVWVDGKWHFMGACEPEPVLDLGWFNAPVSRAMVLTTNVFGDYDGPEGVLDRNECYTVINLIGAYVPSRKNIVSIVDTLGNPVAGAKVSFRIYNYAEFYPVANIGSDSAGCASIETGLGSMLAWASKDGSFGLGKIDSDSTTIVLDHSEGDEFSIDFNLVPPAENPLPDRSNAVRKEENKVRLEAGKAIRESHDKSNPAIKKFKDKYGAAADTLLACLSAKDIDDVEYEVLEDAMPSMPSGDRNIIGPRVELEHLMPFRSHVRSLGLDKTLKSYNDVKNWIAANIKIRSYGNPLRLRMPAAVVLKSGIADERSALIFEVALCRAVGLPASLDIITGDTSMNLEAAEKGVLSIKFKPDGKDWPEYYRDFTLTRLENGTTRLLNFGYDDEETPLDKMKVPQLEKGYYFLTSGKRLSDGSVLSRLDFFNIHSGETVQKELVVRNGSDGAMLIGKLNPESMVFKDKSGAQYGLSALPASDYYLLAFMGLNDEPSMHAVRNLKKFVPELEKRSAAMIVMGNNSLDGLSSRVKSFEYDGAVLDRISKALPGKSCNRPFIAVFSASGSIYYCSQGYNPILVSSLGAVFDELTIE